MKMEKMEQCTDEGLWWGMDAVIDGLTHVDQGQMLTLARMR